jgi:hypothetical protein
MRKISPPPGLDPRTVHLVATRYTDWAIRAGQHMLKLNVQLNVFCRGVYNKLWSVSLLVLVEEFRSCPWSLITIIILWALVLTICLICIRASLEKHFHFHRSVAYWLDTKFCVQLSAFSCFPVGSKQQQTAACCWNSLGSYFLFFGLHYLYTYRTLGANCTAYNGGKLYSLHWGQTVQLTLAANCTAYNGGKLYSVHWRQTVQLTLGANCTAYTGGKLYSLHWGQTVQRTLGANCTVVVMWQMWL